MSVCLSVSVVLFTFVNFQSHSQAEHHKQQQPKPPTGIPPPPPPSHCNTTYKYDKHQRQTNPKNLFITIV
eukprot:m.21770 g.21770  ORF g.21770 m.21770 type:complete len:70 (-) comp13528_c1_seq1:143-352(-)